MLTRRRLLEAAWLMAAAASQPAGASPRHFLHGVASGDPLADRVILWTRVSGVDRVTEVAWELARSPDFSAAVARGTTSADPARDCTVKLDPGGLQPGQVYYYRFRVGDELSPIGRTRTLPGADADGVRLAIVSCSNYPAGYFNVYRALGQRHDLDAVLHLGDYIYEYAVDGYASERAAEFGRLSKPRGELLTLADYRTRHAQYKTDPDLQYVHGRLPFIVSWDDHEVANNSWTGGAQNHNPGEGAYAERVRNALTAYYEWMPIRENAERSREAAYRSFDFGGIATVAMIETRLSGRSEPASFQRDLPPRRTFFDAERPDQAVTAPADGSGAGLLAVPGVFDLTTTPPTAVTDYRRLSRLNAADALPQGYGRLPDTERFEREVLSRPERQLLDTAQRRWLAATLDDAARRGQAHRLIGNQTLMSPVRSADLTGVLSGERLAALPEYLQALIPLTQYDLPADLDNWDGYPAERARVLELMRASGGATVVTGDTHNGWAAPLTDSAG
ncbi:MAG: alkaline phosphatase D family protein, partial [Pseudomonadota bacterium]